MNNLPVRYSPQNYAAFYSPPETAFLGNPLTAIASSDSAKAARVVESLAATKLRIIRGQEKMEMVRAKSQVEIARTNALRDTLLSMSSEVGATVRETGRPFQMKTAVKKPGFLGIMRTETEIVVKGEFLD